TNIRRIGFVASLLARNNTVCLAAAISPYKAIRDEVRGLHQSFVEVYTFASLDTLEGRDVKGLYKKARAGEIKGFTGVDDPYEAPEKAEILIETEKTNALEAAEAILKYLETGGYLSA